MSSFKLPYGFAPRVTNTEAIGNVLAGLADTAYYLDPALRDGYLLALLAVGQSFGLTATIPAVPQITIINSGRLIEVQP